MFWNNFCFFISGNIFSICSQLHSMIIMRTLNTVFMKQEYLNMTCAKFSDVTLTPWRDEVGETIGRVREVSYTIPLNAPFGPKSSNTVEKHSCSKQSQPGVMYVIDAECTPLGIPYSDTFYVMNRYCLTRVSKDKCRLRVTSEVKYRKSVWGMVKSKYYRYNLCSFLKSYI